MRPPAASQPASFQEWNPNRNRSNSKVFVLNYGWMYAGMWQLAKRILPNTALERILFPTKADLLHFFEEDHLLVGTLIRCKPPLVSES